MPPQLIFLTHLILGYVACLLCFVAYIWPKLRSMERAKAHHIIATVHSFRFFGLVFLLPGVVGAGLPQGFARAAAIGDFATGVLALLALVTYSVRPIYWLFVTAFNLVGAADLVLAYYHAVRLGLPELSGQLGAAYVIPVIYVPMLMITHAVALYWLIQRRSVEERQYA